MRVLMSAAASPEAVAAAGLLESAGHQVVRCHEPGDRGLACSVLRGRPCPLDQDVDVAVAVRHRASSDPERLEDGVVCAIRHHVPLLVAGATAHDPFARWAVEAEGEPDVSLVEQVAAAPLGELSRVATETLRRWLDQTRTRSAYDRVEVYRRHGRLVAQVVVDGGMDQAARDMAAVRVQQALRGADRYARVIDVTFGAVAS